MSMMDKYKSRLKSSAPTPERKQTLDMVMTATIIAFRNEIIRSGTWNPSPETHKAEAEIEAIQRNIFEGKGKLLDFREACEKWKRAGMR